VGDESGVTALVEDIQHVFRSLEGGEVVALFEELVGAVTGDFIVHGNARDERLGSLVGQVTEVPPQTVVIHGHLDVMRQELEVDQLPYWTTPSPSS
jgi:hypothetical protein